MEIDDEMGLSSDVILAAALVSILVQVGDIAETCCSTVTASQAFLKSECHGC